MAEEDLIFGKNRHFFGGIEPSNMKEFSLNVVDGSVQVVATLPDDTVVDGQTLCSVAGAVIRRKNNGFPKDEFDGELVINASDSLAFNDDVQADDRYYYAAFPYTTQGVYNRSKLNRAAINAVAMTVSAVATIKPSIELSFTIPDGFTGVVIRRGTTSFPATETDGEEVGTFTSSGTHSDTDVELGLIYLYSFFLYDASGMYLYDERNRLSVQSYSGDYIYGFDLTKATPNPSSRVVYPEDVENYGFTPAAMDFNTGKFNPGSWELSAGAYFMPKPCMLNYDGTVAYYLDPDDYTKKEDGTASDVANTAFGGNAMMEWPKIYTKRWESDDGVYHFRCSNRKIDDDWDCWCNYDRNSNIIEHFYTSIYLGSYSSNRVRSLSNAAISGNITADTEVNYAKANGNDWYTEVLADYLLILDLMVMISKSTDGQTAFGYGYFGPHNTGLADTKGLFYGASNGGFLKVFGMEDLWGYYGRRIAGLISQISSSDINTCTYLVKLTRGTHDGSTATDYNTTGNGYISAGSFAKAGGYIGSMLTTEYGRLPIAGGGSSTTYECDCYYANPSNAGTYYAIVGWDNMAFAGSGPFAVDLYYAPSAADSYIVASMSCKPLASA